MDHYGGILNIKIAKMDMGLEIRVGFVENSDRHVWKPTAWN